MMSIKSVNALSHYTDWTIAHVHAGALGWVGFMSFGMVYWLMPRLFQTKLWTREARETHFWVATVGILLYMVAIYAAGLTQGLMWRAFDETGRLAYPDFVETVTAADPDVLGPRRRRLALPRRASCCAAVNFADDLEGPPGALRRAGARGRAARRGVEPAPGAEPASRRRAASGCCRGAGTARWEGLPVTFTVWVAVAVVVASLFEILPTVPRSGRTCRRSPRSSRTRRSSSPAATSTSREGCYNCHSQMIRPIRAETVRYGEYCKPGEFVYDHPFQWGSRRIGPDLQRVGGKYPRPLARAPLRGPARRSRRSRSCRPTRAGSTPIDFDAIQDARRGAGDARRAVQRRRSASAAELRARAGRRSRARDRRAGRARRASRTRVVALIAYLQRLGTDIKRAGRAGAEGRERWRRRERCMSSATW